MLLPIIFAARKGMKRLNTTKTKVLVIDDDINFCKMLTRAFGIDGSFDVLVVQGALRLEAILKEFKPDVVVLDILLEELDGGNVCKFIRENPEYKNIKIIGISGALVGGDVIRMFDDFLRKPFRFDELKEIILAV